MLETLIVIFIAGLALFGLLQLAAVYSGSEVLHHAAARAARARAVGFNEWMVFKALRVASIPNSGKMTAPAFQPLGAQNPFAGARRPGDVFDAAFAADPAVSERARFERARIPFYLAAANRGRADYELNYEEWERGSFEYGEVASAFGGGVLRMRVRQDFPLQMPFVSFILPFARTDENGGRRMHLEGEGVAGGHSALYLR